ncbi:hypothetical protein ACHQM5_009842 [Ranunculus cassubicifolius]
MASPNLPDDIIENILSRLPAKRFICVSKAWDKLITSHAFAQLHLSRSKGDQLVLGRYGYHYSFLHDVPFDLDVNGDCPLPIRVCDGIVWGSCDGLLCISCRTSQTPDYTLFLWNPSTRECKQLPPPNLTSLRPAFALGYNPSTMDYEILGMCSDFHCYNMNNEIEGMCDSLGDPGSVVDLYTLKENSWQTISSHIPYSIGSPTSRVLLHSKHHWNAFQCALRHISILSYDIKDRTFQEIPLPKFEYDPPCDAIWIDEWGNFQMSPPPDLEDEGPDIVLTTLYDCLCVCRPHRKQVEAWIMRVYGDAESWTKLFSIETEFGTNSLTPLFCNTDGAILMLNNNDGLALYDRKDGSLRILSRYHINERCSFQVKTYKQSMVALGIGSYNAETLA